MYISIDYPQLKITLVAHKGEYEKQVKRVKRHVTKTHFRKEFSTLIKCGNEELIFDLDSRAAEFKALYLGGDKPDKDKIFDYIASVSHVYDDREMNFRIFTAMRSGLNFHFLYDIVIEIYVNRGYIINLSSIAPASNYPI